MATSKAKAAAKDEPVTTDYVAPDVGVAVVVIRDGGAYEHPGTIAAVGADSEALGGTWLTVITDPESNEHMQISALRLDTEEACRERSARDRIRYFAWCVEPVEPGV